MHGAVSASLLMEIAYQNGYREQLTFFKEFPDVFPPCIYISRSKLASVGMGFTWNDSGYISSKDHPAFTELRDRLENEGYIKTQRNWSNGDRVTKPFYLNNMYFDVGEQFSCAPALGGSYDIALRKNECSPEYGGISDRPFKPEKDTESSEGDTQTSGEFVETLPLPI